MKISEIIQPDKSLRAATLYHGTSTKDAAESIKRNGLKSQPQILQQKYSGHESMIPIAGGIYLTRDFGNAVRYSFMSEVKDEQYLQFVKSEPYGYVFEVDGSQLTGVTPDEDQYGNILHQIVLRNPTTPQLSALLSRIPTHLRSTLQQKSIDYPTVALAGKWFIHNSSPSLQAYALNRYSNVVNFGTMMPTAVWTIPKPDRRHLQDRGWRRDGTGKPVPGSYDTMRAYAVYGKRWGSRQTL